MSGNAEANGVDEARTGLVPTTESPSTVPSSSFYDSVTIKNGAVIACKGNCTVYFVVHDQTVDMCFGDKALGVSVFYGHVAVADDMVFLGVSDEKPDNQVPLDGALRAALKESGFV